MSRICTGSVEKPIINKFCEKKTETVNIYQTEESGRWDYMIQKDMFAILECSTGETLVVLTHSLDMRDEKKFRIVFNNAYWWKKCKDSFQIVPSIRENMPMDSRLLTASVIGSSMTAFLDFTVVIWEIRERRRDIIVVTTDAISL